MHQTGFKLSYTYDTMARLSILNPDPQVLSGPELLHELLADHANSNAIAIDYESSDGHRQQVSYAELHARSDALAFRITGFRQSSRFIVPLYIPQSPELYIAELAVLKAGAAFCPVALDMPDDRLRFILTDVDATILLTTTSVNTRLPSLDGVEILKIDDTVSHDLPPSADVSIYNSVPSRNDAAYIM